VHKNYDQFYKIALNLLAMCILCKRVANGGSDYNARNNHLNIYIDKDLKGRGRGSIRHHCKCNPPVVVNSNVQLPAASLVLTP
jgi:hypothetical protein